VILAAACGSTKSGDGKGAAASAADSKVASVAPDAAEPAGDPHQAFRELAAGVAKRTTMKVIAWGTAPLGDGETLHRYAVLDPDSDDTEVRGAYLLEAEPGKVFRISFYADGRTMAWGRAEGSSRDSDPAWTAETSRAVTHAQGHHHGGETIELALRGGKPVVLVHEYTGDAETEVTERREFAKDGVCKDPCPALAGFETEDADLQVTGPASTVEGLVGE
jgi:hypothetical protein